MSQHEALMLPHMIDIDALTRQACHLDSMVAMLHQYFDSVAEGGDVLSPALLSGYLWQMQHTIFELKDSIDKASPYRITEGQVLNAATGQ